MRPHVSAETMARYRQGDLNQRRSSHISTHLAGCDRCSALSQDLGGVTTLLASADPPPIPEDLTARITSAIAAESARRAAAPDARTAPDVGTAPACGATGRPAAPACPASPPRSRSAASPQQRQWSSSPAASTRWSGAAARRQAAHRPACPLPPGLPPGRRATRPWSRRCPPPGPPCSTSTAGARTTSPRSPPAPISPRRSSPARSPRKSRSTARDSRRRARTLSPRRVWNGKPSRRAARADGNVRGHPSGGAAGCVDRIAAGSLVLLVDVARYSGAPATIIVTEAAETGPMQIWVVGTGCSASSSDVLQRAVVTAP